MHGACGYALGILTVGGYSYFLEPRWIEVVNIVVPINDLPRQFEGMTIAQLSDIHHCEHVSREYIKKCVRKVNALSPDIIALTGDFIYGSDSFVWSVAEELSELKSKEGVFAILGNHDDKELTSEALSRRGLRVLINEHQPIYRKKEYIYIAGVDDLWRGKLELDATLAGMENKPKILLCHNPDAIEMIQHKNVDLVIAGHTHGGQIRLPLYGPPVVYSKFGTRYASGLFREGETTMYVNKGIGISNFPVRFFARPEITLFTLRNNRQLPVT